MPDRFPIIRKGYDPKAVDEKISTLEDIIKSYKERDSAINNAIINAQIAADNVVMNAKAQATEIRKIAMSQLSDIHDSIEALRQSMTRFQEEYNQMAKKYIQDFNQQDIGAIFEKITALEAQLEIANVEVEIPKPERMTKND